MKNYLKIYLCASALLWLALSMGNAQQRPQFSQYMINNYLFNPAATGANDYIDTRLGFRNQWSGFEGAPKTFFLSSNGKLDLQPRAKGPLPTIGTVDYGNLKRRKSNYKKEDELKSEYKIRHGVGGFMMYDQTGALTRWMIYGSYALHVPIKNGLYASLGVHAGLLRHGLDGSQLVSDPFNPNAFDPALSGGTLATLVPDLALGLMVYKNGNREDNQRKPGYYVGFSINQLLKSNLSFSGIEKNKLAQHYYISAGYSYPLGEKISIIPSLLIHFVEGAPVSYFLNARAAFQLGEKNNIWLGSGYSNQGTFPFLAGIGISKFLSLNFSYDLVNTGLKNYTKNILPANVINTQTYELSLGLRLLNKKPNYEHNLF